MKKKVNTKKMSEETGLSFEKIRRALNPFGMFSIKEKTSKTKTMKELRAILRAASKNSDIQIES
ncbi:hypothetical protein KAJ38_02425 [Candidatus Pacearchaeota archaeon]|nr:hypothetical protein [Candidatus Pacearchaeota archaeon]